MKTYHNEKIEVLTDPVLLSQITGGASGAEITALTFMSAKGTMNLKNIQLSYLGYLLAVLVLHTSSGNFSIKIDGGVLSGDLVAPTSTIRMA